MSKQILKSLSPALILLCLCALLGTYAVYGYNWAASLLLFYFWALILCQGISALFLLALIYVDKAIPDIEPLRYRWLYRGPSIALLVGMVASGFVVTVLVHVAMIVVCQFL